jgi:hypothetical protein
MSSTGNESKSGSTSVIDLTQLDTVINGIEKEYNNVQKKISEVESSLQGYLTRVTSIGKLPGHRVKAENLPLGHLDTVHSDCGPEGGIVDVKASCACHALDPVFLPDFDQCKKLIDFGQDVELDHKQTMQKLQTCWKHMESLMLVPSTGKFREGEGGVYQTPRPAHLVHLLTKIHPYVTSILNDFPDLKKSSVTMIDAGAGMHIPVVLGAVLGGYRSIGLEIDENRTAIAADFVHNVMHSFPKAKLSLFNRDLTKPGNWSKVVVFFFWDRVGGTPLSFLVPFLR